MTTPLAGPVLPTTLRFDVTEYLDRTALPGVRFTVEATWRTERKLDFVDVPDDRAGRRSGATTVRERLVQPDQEPCGTKSGVSGPDGRATFRWDPRADVQYASAWTTITGRNPDLVPRLSFRAGMALRPGVIPDLFTLPEEATNGTTLVRPVSIDLAATIVGHVTDTTARIWFAPAGAIRQPGLTVSFEHTATAGRARRRPTRLVSFTSGPHPHAVVDLRGLAPNTEYQCWLVVSDGATRWEGARSTFRTADPAATGLRLAFASCNKPSSDGDLERWRAMREWHPDLQMLLGDQVYADTDRQPSSWSAHYGTAYRRQWSHRPIREAMRHAPTYMMHDDHDVDDDWGTKFTTIDAPPPPSDLSTQLRAAREALDAYQHSHNPPMPHRRTTDDAYDYALRRGPVAIYVLDERMRRGIETADPVLGADQWTRLRTWATSADVATADVVILVSPVPLAFCDVQVAQAAIETWNRLIGTVEWLTAPAWAITEWLFGHGIADLKVDTEYANGQMVEPDLADQWTHDTNRAELGRLLDLLFDLQNDPTHRRAVIVVSGDAHISMLHSLVSWNSARHPGNVIYQLTSSPIGLQPDGGLEQAADVLGDIWGPFNLHGFQVVPTPAGYTGQQLESAARRSFGSVSVRRRTEPGRIYEVRLALQFQPGPPALGGDEIRLDLRYDLDRGGPPTPLVPLVAPVRIRRGR